MEGLAGLPGVLAGCTNPPGLMTHTCRKGRPTVPSRMAFMAPAHPGIRSQKDDSPATPEEVQILGALDPVPQFTDLQITRLTLEPPGGGGGH